MAYVDRILQPGERILAKGRLHWVIFVPSAALIIVALAVAVWARASGMSPDMARYVYILAAVVGLFGVIGFLGRMILRATTEFAVTDRRVIAKRGLLSLHTIEMNEDKVESVDVDQTILARMLGYGTVTVHGVGSRWDPIARIADPLKFRSAITLRGAPPQAETA